MSGLLFRMFLRQAYNRGREFNSFKRSLAHTQKPRPMYDLI